jgi:glucokinase
MKNFEIAAFLRKEAGVPAVAENDATVAALAEYRLGAGRGANDFLMATVGTGLGGGLVVNGRLIRGRFGTAAEIGHGVFQPNGIECGCGGRGCLEQYVGAAALLRFYGTQKVRGRGAKHWTPTNRPRPSEGLSQRDVIERARAGERAAVDAVAWLGRNLGLGLATCASLVPVEVAAIGGGMSVLGPLLLRPVRAAFQEQALPYVRKTVRIVRAKLGNDAGFTGAALLAFDALAPARGAGRIRRARAR